MGGGGQGVALEGWTHLNILFNIGQVVFLSLSVRNQVGFIVKRCSFVLPG